MSKGGFAFIGLVAAAFALIAIQTQDSVQIKTKNGSNSDTARILVSTGANTADVKVNNANLWMLKNGAESYPFFLQANNGADITMGLKFNTAGGTNRISFLNNAGTEIFAVADSGNLTTSGSITAGSVAAGSATVGGSPVLTQATVFSGDVGGFYNNLQLVSNSVGAQEISDGSISAAETTGTFITAGIGISVTNTGPSWSITNTGVTSFNGSGGAVTGVTSVGANSPLSSSGGTTPTISLAGIVGIANGGTGTSTFTASQFLWYDGSTIASSGYSPSSFMSGSGTTNYVPKFTSASTLGNSLIFDNGTYVGVGTAVPWTQFTVTGSMACTATIQWNGGYDLLTPDQGGSIELGGTNSLANPVTGGIPYIDFHFGTGGAQDYNVRLINDASGQLHTYGNSVDENFYTCKGLPDTLVGTGDATFPPYEGIIVQSNSSGTTHDRGIRPTSADWGYVGNATQYWYRMYAFGYFGKTTSITAFDAYPDLDMLDAMTIETVTDTKTGESREVFTNIPSQIRDSTGDFVDFGAAFGLTFGAHRQLNAKLKVELALRDAKIEQLESTVKSLEDRLSTLETKVGK